VAGIFASEKKEILLKDIKEQLAMGEIGLKEEDKWLLEVGLSDLDCDSAGEEEAYWVMTITTTQGCFHLNQRTQSHRQHCNGTHSRRDISMNMPYM
jgi:hypothetical protein